jgi:hypothetical protein
LPVRNSGIQFLRISIRHLAAVRIEKCAICDGLAPFTFLGHRIDVLDRGDVGAVVNLDLIRTREASSSEDDAKRAAPWVILGAERAQTCSGGSRVRYVSGRITCDISGLGSLPQF